MCPECRKWWFRFTKTRLAAELRPNLLGELTALPQTLSWRPAHFLVASAAYDCKELWVHAVIAGIFHLAGDTELISGPANFTICIFNIRSTLHPHHTGLSYCAKDTGKWG